MKIIKTFEFHDREQHAFAMCAFSRAHSFVDRGNLTPDEWMEARTAWAKRQVEYDRVKFWRHTKWKLN